MGVHDLSRIEWVAHVGLPQSGMRKYQVEFSLEIPLNLYSLHNVWDHKQSYTRLQSPTEEGDLRVELSDLDALRRDTLGMAHRLKQKREKFERDCAQAAARSDLLPSLEPGLVDVICRGIDTVAEMRRVLGPTSDEKTHSPEIKHEIQLADEFLSHQLVEFLSAAQKALDEVLLGAASRLPAEQMNFTDAVREQLGEALAREIGYRREHGFLNPHADSPAELSAFVERASRLKKHFQGVLFLDVEAYMVDQKVRNWTGAAAAALAAAFWLTFTLLPMGQGTRAGIGVGTFAILFAVAYALKDRVKELTRGWLAGRLVRMYGQRVVTLRVPSRLCAPRPVLVHVRERFDAESQTGDDSLDLSLAHARKVVVLRYRMWCQALACPPLERAGLRSIKHIFRYDVTPIFSRLDNAVKRVPVLDASARRVRFADAPKEYRFPLKLVARAGTEEATFDGLLVLSKRGIERIEQASDTL